MVSPELGAYGVLVEAEDFHDSLCPKNRGMTVGEMMNNRALLQPDRHHPRKLFSGFEWGKGTLPPEETSVAGEIHRAIG